MKTYEFLVSWTVTGKVRVKAPTKEEAREIAADTDLDMVDDQEYLESSFTIDEEPEDD